MDKFQFNSFVYKNIIKPILFTIDAEKVHNGFTGIGESMGMDSTGRAITQAMFSFEDPKLEKTVDGNTYKNPIGLAAGFDYDGHLAEIMSHVGFGLNTVGTVTAKPYDGNEYPRLGRLPKSKSLFVNKGFKSAGAKKVAELLDKKSLTNGVIGISIGSSNIPEVDTIQKAINDYVEGFKEFKDKEYVKYFELNISCPNTKMLESFVNKENLDKLLKAVKELDIKVPIYVKMPNEIELDLSNMLVQLVVDYGLQGVIFTNLVKSRNNKGLNREELMKFEGKNGNFSGKPTLENANMLIKHTREKFGKDLTIIGCGGVFTGQDAKDKLDAGADLVQLISGMIFEGPQVVGEINRHLSNLN
jgi:dihydroorotate dehydrogenase subfamily 2